MKNWTERGPCYFGRYPEHCGDDLAPEGTLPVDFSESLSFGKEPKRLYQGEGGEVSPRKKAFGFAVLAVTGASVGLPPMEALSPPPVVMPLPSARENRERAMGTTAVKALTTKPFSVEVGRLPSHVQERQVLVKERQKKEMICVDFNSQGWWGEVCRVLSPEERQEIRLFDGVGAVKYENSLALISGRIWDKLKGEGVRVGIAKNYIWGRPIEGERLYDFAVKHACTVRHLAEINGYRGSSEESRFFRDWEKLKQEGLVVPKGEAEINILWNWKEEGKISEGARVEAVQAEVAIRELLNNVGLNSRGVRVGVSRITSEPFDVVIVRVGKELEDIGGLTEGRFVEREEDVFVGVIGSGANLSILYVGDSLGNGLDDKGKDVMVGVVGERVWRLRPRDFDGFSTTGFPSGYYNERTISVGSSFALVRRNGENGLFRWFDKDEGWSEWPPTEIIPVTGEEFPLESIKTQVVPKPKEEPLLEGTISKSTEEQVSTGEVVLRNIPVDIQDNLVSCESSAAGMAAAGVENGFLPDGYGTWEEYFMDVIPSNPNPHEGFRGNVETGGGQTMEGAYGVYVEPVAEAFRKAKIPCRILGGGENYKRIEEHIRMGYPVMVWISGEMDAPIEIWTDPETGQKVKLISGEHVWLVTGVSADGSRFLVHEPYPGMGGKFWVTIGKGRRNFPNWGRAFDGMALVVGTE